MKTPTELWKIHAFVDGELDLATQLEMEQRLHDDAAMRRQVQDVRELRQLVRENAQQHAAPAALRTRVASLLEQSQREPAGQSQVQPGAGPRAVRVLEMLQGWLAWKPLVASMSFGAVLAVAVNLAWLQSSNEERLTQEVVASHVRSTLGQHLVDVSSADHHTVKPFLSSRLGFSPPVADALPVPGSAFLGGRVDYLDGRPVAALVYRQGEHVVNSFIWPGTGGDRKPHFSAERGYQTAHWAHNGMNHWVISDVNPQEFQTMVNALQVSDAAR